MNNSRPFAIVTGASSGIGLDLAREAAKRGYDLLIAADRIARWGGRGTAAHGGTVVAVQADLATPRWRRGPVLAVDEPPRRCACSPTPATAWARAFSTRTSPKCST